ncbi:unnamed protein product [Adineta steineri]|uniref:Uncharacterized protein n=2 Tax=Adineta steineri TaxID=433720 RepID=A0A815A1C0_9BILA|nr:unnamed protein product [Adineta steineri]
MTSTAINSKILLFSLFFNSFNKIIFKFSGLHIFCCRCQSHPINAGNRLYEIYPTTDSGWYPEFDEKRFPYYPSKIENIIHPDNYSRLQSLVLPTASSKLIQLIFHGEFPRLKACHLGRCESIILPRSMTIQLQNLRQLTIRKQPGHVLEKILLIQEIANYLHRQCPLLKILVLCIHMRGHMLRDSSIEVYYQYGQCAVTAKYSKKNMKLTHRIMDMLDDLSIVYWPDCQSLLNVLRNETYNIWDQDVDLSIEWPFKSNHIHSKLNNLQLFIETFQSNDFNVEYYPDRKLFSLSSVNEKSARQPHVDIWLWKRYDEHEIKPVLQLFDSSLKYQSRLISDIYPLQSVTWLGRNVKIPKQSHKIAYKEYGTSYMKPIFIRNNCLHNLIDGRWFYNR